MNIWLTTDTHFGHPNLITLYGRPKDYENRIIANLNLVLQKGDLLIHLGDVAIKRQGFYNTFFTSHFDGVTKMLLRGNHDQNSTQWYLNHGWNIVGEDFNLNFKGKKIILSHVPQRSLSEKSFDFNVHGHFHDNNHRLSDYPFLNERHKRLALEWTDYKPVKLEDFLQL